MSKSVPSHFTLNNGVQIPAVGLGTWQAKPGEVRDAVSHALKIGYRHLDCALIYQNEHEVGQGIKDSGVPRKDIFITSKVWNTHQPDVADGLRQTLEALGTDYLDLYVSPPITFRVGVKDYNCRCSGRCGFAEQATV
jgi:glycerol 2-dehydrogenase (NADP+)